MAEPLTPGRATNEVWDVAMGRDAATPQFARRIEAAFKAQADEVKRLRAQVAAVEALLDDRDDPYVHVHPVGQGEPDCAACWVADIRAAAGHNG